MPVETTVALAHKLKRFSTSLLPVEAGRQGSCNRCGACCQLPFPCPFLRFDEEGLSSCSIYYARPPSCRKYPRSANENVTPETCGFYFADVKDLGLERGTGQAG
jgi:Fe-S-cluster containining protein